MKNGTRHKQPPAALPAQPLPVRVECREGEGQTWAEATHLTNATPRGATFTLTRQPRLGQLLQLTLPTPRQRHQPPPPASPQPRAGAEHANTLWALVWALTEGAPTARADDDGARYAVSVMFVAEEVADDDGAHAPVEYGYEFEEGGRCRLRERAELARAARPVERRRRETRLHLPLEVMVEALGPDGAVTAREQTVTENISRRGAAVWTTLALKPGSRVRLASEHYGVSVNSVVRARRAGADGIARLHLEFTDREWPLEGVS